ncbi:hypothetical protein ABK040_010072 [Willaertia magna]
MKEEITILSRIDNFSISGYLFYKEDESKEQTTNINKIIFVIINTATGVLQQYYHTFAEYIINDNNETNNKIFVITYDYRGIGKSKPQSTKNGSDLKGLNYNITDWGTKDFIGVIDFVKNYHEMNYNNIPLETVVLGHSVGGHILCMTPGVISKQINRVILFSCFNAYFGYFNHYLRSWDNFKSYCAQQTFFKTIPLLTPIYGYFPSKKVFNSMEDLPSNVAKQWNYFTKHPEYVVDDKGKAILPKGFENTDFLALAFEDDPFTNKNSIQKMNEKFINRTKSFHCVTIQKSDNVEIGHVGFFKKSVRDKTNLWKEVKDYIINGNLISITPFKSSKL